MTQPIRSERQTQDRVVRLFTQDLGYAYLGNWKDRRRNRNLEDTILTENLKRRGYSDSQISSAKVELEAALDPTGITLYEANLRTYNLLRFGVSVSPGAGQVYQTVHLIDWENPQNNQFAIAEEVTLRGGHERRPDLVLYINGIAVGVIELKRSSVEVADGVRQLITNQEEIFNQKFFTTVQLVFAGSDSQGLRYGTTGTPEKFFVQWKDTSGNPADQPGSLLDLPLKQMCNKEQLLDWIRNCIIFDAGQKKVPRPHQYAGFKAAQERLSLGEGGVIWHTQGSGKSILMVMLAKWILENDPQARILVVTDRDELDQQIEGVMRNAGVVGNDAASPRILSRADFTQKLVSPSPRLLCALLHKFDPSDLDGAPPPIFGKFYVMVDECHRTQGGTMHRQMKRWLSDAIFIGFTGTPLLRQDKQTTLEVFGSYIHTYKFHQAVIDKVVLDLKYEARDVPQRLTGQQAIDRWFERKTQGLNNFQKAALRQRWATLENLMSSQERKNRIISSIIEDFDLRPRLNNDRGSAMLVAASIYDACHYYRLFLNTRLGPNVGIVTSYEPNAGAISREAANSDERYKYDTYIQFVLRGFSNTAAYESEIKRRFIKEPATTKLLIVVSKLLTGFDAPSCTYIYLDNELRDHNLFQAICRTNRLDGEDKDYGYIVDFKGLFQNLQEAITVYTAELDDSDGIDQGPSSNNILLKNWLKEGAQQLRDAREGLHYLCDPVPPPKQIEQFLRYFCGDAADPQALSQTESLRVSFYKSVVGFVRAYANLSNNLSEAGFSSSEATRIQEDVNFYSEIRAAMKKHSGEEFDIKPFEADMRHLLNTYIQADPAEQQGELAQLPLTELMVRSGIQTAIDTRLNPKGQLSEGAIAEAIVNNLRKTIIRESLTDPRFYQEMSLLLEDLIAKSRAKAAAYEEFLRQAQALAEQVLSRPHQDLPAALEGNPPAAVLYRNLPQVLQNAQLPDTWIEPDHLLRLTLDIDEAMRCEIPADWRGTQARETAVKRVLHRLLDKNHRATLDTFDLVLNLLEY